MASPASPASPAYPAHLSTPLQKAKALHAYFNCIAALAKELFGKRFLEKTETCKRRKGVKKMYNYKTAKTNTAILAILNIAMKIMAWQDRQEDIDPEFARLYGPYLLTLG